MKSYSESARAAAARVGRICAVLALAVAGVATGSKSPSTARATVQAGNDAAQPSPVTPRISLRVVRRDLRSGQRVAVRGRASGTHERYVRIEIRRRGGAWHRVGVARLRANGFFKDRWRAERHGQYQTRARVIAPKQQRATGKARRYDVYRAAHASWYGPGLYGGLTACGQRLTASIVGVAHKTLPCGTRVTFRYGGREVLARVIDRGPFISGREWDLTGAAKRRLGFPDTGTVLSTR